MEQEDYKNLVAEIIQKQMDILGPEIALQKAKNVRGLRLEEDGTVTRMEGNPEEILQKLVDEYIALSGEIVKNILNPVFAKYPRIKLKIKS